MSLVQVLARLSAVSSRWDRMPASARAEPGLQLGGELPVEVGGEQRFAVGRARDAGFAELGARVLDGVVGELLARASLRRVWPARARWTVRLDTPAPAAVCATGSSRDSEQDPLWQLAVRVLQYSASARCCKARAPSGQAAVDDPDDPNVAKPIAGRSAGLRRMRSRGQP